MEKLHPFTLSFLQIREDNDLYIHLDPTLLPNLQNIKMLLTFVSKGKTLYVGDIFYHKKSNKFYMFSTISKESTQDIKDVKMVELNNVKVKDDYELHFSHKNMISVNDYLQYRNDYQLIGNLFIHERMVLEKNIREKVVTEDNKVYLLRKMKSDLDKKKNMIYTSFSFYIILKDKYTQTPVFINYCPNYPVSFYVENYITNEWEIYKSLELFFVFNTYQFLTGGIYQPREKFQERINSFPSLRNFQLLKIGFDIDKGVYFLNSTNPLHKHYFFDENADNRITKVNLENEYRFHYAYNERSNYQKLLLQLL